MRERFYFAEMIDIGKRTSHDASISIVRGSPACVIVRTFQTLVSPKVASYCALLYVISIGCYSWMMKEDEVMERGNLCEIHDINGLANNSLE